jgi:hypothetical protein
MNLALRKTHEIRFLNSTVHFITKAVISFYLHSLQSQNAKDVLSAAVAIHEAPKYKLTIMYDEVGQIGKEGTVTQTSLYSLRRSSKRQGKLNSSEMVPRPRSEQDGSQAQGHRVPASFNRKKMQQS